MSDKDLGVGCQVSGRMEVARLSPSCKPYGLEGVLCSGFSFYIFFLTPDTW